MDNAVCHMTGAEFPLFAFSHDVVDAVKCATDVGQDFKSEFADAHEQFTRTVEGR